MRVLRGDGIKVIGVNTKASKEIYDKLVLGGEKSVIPIGVSKNENSSRGFFKDIFW